ALHRLGVRVFEHDDVMTRSDLDGMTDRGHVDELTIDVNLRPWLREHPHEGGTFHDPARVAAVRGVTIAEQGPTEGDHGACTRRDEQPFEGGHHPGWSGRRTPIHAALPGGRKVVGQTSV